MVLSVKLRQWTRSLLTFILTCYATFCKRNITHRQEGIKLVRPIQRREKDTVFRQRSGDNSLKGPEYPQPCTMRLGRDYAIPCTAQCDKEVCILGNRHSNACDVGQ